MLPMLNTIGVRFFMIEEYIFRLPRRGKTLVEIIVGYKPQPWKGCIIWWFRMLPMLNIFGVRFFMIEEYMFRLPRRSKAMVEIIVSYKPQPWKGWTVFENVYKL